MGEEETQKLAEVSGKLMRTGEYSAYERILCSHLVEAISATTLDAICHTTAAAMMLTETDKEALEIDTEEVEIVYTMSHLLDNVNPYKEHEDDSPQVRVSLWSLDYKKYVLPWVKVEAYSHWVPPRPGNVNEVDANYLKLRHEGGDDFMIYTARMLTPNGYQHMVNDFVRWSFPKVQTLTQKISSLISPVTYSEILKLFTEGKRVE